MKNDLSWDYLKLVLAICRAGTLAGAARGLSISHATAYRRLNALEQQLDVTLFERGHDGYVATRAGQRLAGAALDAEAAIEQATGALADTPDTPAGPLRITTTDTLYAGLLAPVFERFRQRYPQVVLWVETSNAVSDLGRREADIAIRPGNAPPEHLVGRRLGWVHQAIYRARSSTVDTTNGWIGPDDAMGYPALARWFEARPDERTVVCRVNSGLAAQAAVAAGTGQAVLPCYLGDADPRLCRLGPPIDELTTALWLLLHAQRRGTPSVRAFAGELAEALGPRLAPTRAAD